MAQVLYAAIKLSRQDKGEDAWKADLRWGSYSVCGWGGDCHEALECLLGNLIDLAPAWLLQETATDTAVILGALFPD